MDHYRWYVLISVLSPCGNNGIYQYGNHYFFGRETDNHRLILYIYIYILIYIIYIQSTTLWRQHTQNRTKKSYCVHTQKSMFSISKTKSRCKTFAQAVGCIVHTFCTILYRISLNNVNKLNKEKKGIQEASKFKYLNFFNFIIKNAPFNH